MATEIEELRESVKDLEMKLDMLHAVWVRCHDDLIQHDKDLANVQRQLFYLELRGK